MTYLKFAKFWNSVILNDPFIYRQITQVKFALMGENVQTNMLSKYDIRIDTRYFSFKGIFSMNKNGKCEAKDMFQRKANDDQSLVSNTSIRTKVDWNRNSMPLPFELSNIDKNDS